MKKMDKAQQTDGKIDKPTVRSLDELFNFRKAQYDTHNEETYAKRLKEMTIADLQNECSRVGLTYRSERDVMTGRLMKQFRIYTAGILGAGKTQPDVIRSKKAAKIMSENSPRV